MHIFLSWSGEASRGAASTLRRYLPCMLQDLTVFMSEHDLESGGRWAHQLAAELSEAQFGVICLTPDNLQSPWLLFEAGALTKHIEGRACGLLFGLVPTDVAGPLAQFQHRIFGRRDFYELLRDINHKLANPLASDQLQMVFDKWWPDLERECLAVVQSAQQERSRGPGRDQRDVLDEILSKVRAIERNIQTGIHTDIAQAPSQARAEQEAESIENSAKHVIVHLNDRQRAVLAELVNPDATRRTMEPTLFEERHRWGDLQRLMASGLVEKTMNGYSLTHDAIAVLVKELVPQSVEAAQGATADSGRNSERRG
jgi:hypothetical protein